MLRIGRQAAWLLGLSTGLTILMPLRLGAQEVWMGLIGGVGRSSFGGGDEGALWDERFVAPAVGMSSWYQLSESTALRVELRYAQLGGAQRHPPGRRGPQAVNEAVLYDYLELPIMFEVGAPFPGTRIARVLVRGGPVPAVVLACEHKEEPAASGGFVGPDTGVPCASRQSVGLLEAVAFAAPNRIAIGIALDAVVRLALSRQLSAEMGARWQFGLRSVDAYSPDRIKHRALFFEIGLAHALSF